MKALDTCGLTRRLVLTGGGASLLLMPLSGVKAQYVEAAIAIVKVVISAIEQLKAAHQQAAMVATVAEINLKLDFVLRNQIVIISELAKIENDVSNIVPDLTQQKLQAVADKFAAFESVSFKVPQSQLIALLSDAESATTELVDLQYPLFSGFAAGWAIMIILLKLTQQSAQLSSFSSSYKPRVAKWLDATDQRSLSALIDVKKADIESRRSALETNASQNPHWYSEVSVFNLHAACTQKVGVNISGTFVSNFTGTQLLAPNLDCVSYLPSPQVPSHAIIAPTMPHSIEHSEISDIKPSTNIQPAYSLPLDSGVSSDIPPLQSVLNERSSIIKEMIYVNSLQSMADQISALLRTL